jgi:hypothetical protein
MEDFQNIYHLFFNNLMTAQRKNAQNITDNSLVTVCIIHKPSD